MVTLRFETAERRPRTTEDAAQDRITAECSDAEQSTDLAARVRRHRYALYVLAERADGRIVGQVYTSLHPAERKVARTRERGLRATMSLVELRPIGLELDTSTVPSSVADLLSEVG